VVAGVEMAKSILDTWGTELGLNYVLIDPMLIANPGDLELRRRKMNAGTPIWCERDHVHLTSDGYKDIADTVLYCSFEKIRSEHSALTVASTSSSGARSKRKMVEPVVTMPKERPKAKRCRDASCNQLRPCVGSWESMLSQAMESKGPPGVKEEGGLSGVDGG
jgi:hypothetical protein